MDALTKTVVHQFLLQVYDRSKTTVFFITHDLEEAIFLGSKVYIMTTRPATIKRSSTWTSPPPRLPRAVLADLHAAEGRMHLRRP